MDKKTALISDLKDATARLAEALAEPSTDLIRDASIQRFEFTMDLAWKVMKAVLEDKYGLTCINPMDCIRTAFKQGIIEDDSFWLEMVRMRNQTSHMYLERLAVQVFNKLPEALKRFQSLLDQLTQQSSV